jgi:uncharacterized membrane protein
MIKRSVSALPWRLVSALAILAASPMAHAAVNSYRFMHVTIDTPWHIFFFLMLGVFSPFILMVILLWRHSFRKRQTTDPSPSQPTPPH